MLSTDGEFVGTGSDIEADAILWPVMVMLVQRSLKVVLPNRYPNEMESRNDARIALLW